MPSHISGLRSHISDKPRVRFRVMVRIRAIMAKFGPGHFDRGHFDLVSLFLFNVHPYIKFINLFSEQKNQISNRCMASDFVK